MILKMTGKVFFGIDYSISCPAMCIHEGDNWSYDNCHFYYLTSRKKSLINCGNITSELHKSFSSNEERFDQIADFFISQIDYCCRVLIEAYSFGSIGQVFNIAECTGILKHKLYLKNCKIETLPPTSLKKYASDRGNATKLFMHSAFQKETNKDFSKLVNCEPGDSPACDCIDAYYLCKYSFDKHINEL